MQTPQSSKVEREDPSSVVIGVHVKGATRKPIPPAYKSPLKSKRAKSMLKKKEEQKKALNETQGSLDIEPPTNVSDAPPSTAPQNDPNRTITSTSPLFKLKKLSGAGSISVR